MVRSFRRNGGKHYGTSSLRERHDRASAAPPVRARWRGHAVRAAIQRSQALLSQLSQELGTNPKTVAKWRKRATVEDMTTGPTEPRSTVLTEAQEAAIVAFRRHMLLPLDDCLYALPPSVQHLNRSALDRCLQRTASPAFRMSKATSPSARSSSATPSASSISTLPRCRRLKVSSIYL